MQTAGSRAQLSLRRGAWPRAPHSRAASPMSRQHGMNFLLTHPTLGIPVDAELAPKTTGWKDTHMVGAVMTHSVVLRM